MNYTIPHFVTLSLCLVTLSTTLFANCSDLYFSEVYSGSNSNNFDQNGNSVVDGITVEIYNPTEGEISLEEYVLTFVLSSSESVSISLTGSISSYETAVLSSTSSENIDYLVNSYYNFPSITQLTSIYLQSPNGTVLDRLGSIETDKGGEQIDLFEFVSDPSYFKTIDFGVKTLTGLSVRKVGHYQGGTPAGYSSAEQFLDQWMIYPVIQEETFGNHLGSCQTPMMYWQGVNSLEPEYTFEEFRGVNGPGEFPQDFVNPSIALTETADQDIEINLFDALHEYITFSDPSATEGLDYISDDITAERIISAGDVIFVLDQFTWAIDDAVPEMGEGFAFRLNAVAGGQIIADPDRDVIDYRIVDITSPTVELGEKSGLNLYPNVVNSNFRIEADSEKNQSS